MACLTPLFRGYKLLNNNNNIIIGKSDIASLCMSVGVCVCVCVCMRV